MSLITTTGATQRLTRKLQRAGLSLWVGVSSGDCAGKYLLFRVGGKCVGGAGWNLAECESKVDHLIKWKDEPESPPWEG